MSAEYDKHCEEFDRLYNQIVIEALEIAFQEIDNENKLRNSKKPGDHAKSFSKRNEPHIITDFEELQIEMDSVYENIDDILEEKTSFIENEKIGKSVVNNHQLPLNKKIEEQNQKKKSTAESYYQIPNDEPYYEVPKTKPVPLYENIDMFGMANNVSLEDRKKLLEPPKEKPPPPPVDEINEEEVRSVVPTEQEKQEMFKRINSTKRIKKEIWNKRSSFLGIEGPDDSVFELNVAPPPDMTTLLEEERRLQRQLIMKAGFSDSSDTGESRDSGVSENHSRQSSEPFSVEEQDTEKIIDQREPLPLAQNDEEARIKSIEQQIREQERRFNYDDTFDTEEVLRVERELLQLEKEELDRQRGNLLNRENFARRELEFGDKMLMSTEKYTISPGQHPHQAYQVETDYRKSMPDLQKMMEQTKRPATNPLVKPLRAQFQQDYLNSNPLAAQITSIPFDNNLNMIPLNNIPADRLQHRPPIDDFSDLYNYPKRTPSVEESNIYANMTKHTLHALSATPKPKLTNEWIQYPRMDQQRDIYQEVLQKKEPYLRNPNYNHRTSDSWIQNQQKRRSDPQGFNYNSHWLIQEAEQRRLEQQRGLRSDHNKKPLPDSVIQTITQRVQNMGIGDRRRSYEPNFSLSNNDVSQLHHPESHDKVLSVSGKKKCSHCGNELGRGAAMIIESLRLFYHIDCFKCSVCHTSLGDGLGGTDVRVRNSKLHCQNCYSNDDGVKFSCV